MLSVLIPTFNCSCLRLVSELARQIDALGIESEIVVVDDASTDAGALSDNEKIASVNHCRYVRLDHRIDISHMRNRLLQEAKYRWLLCLDADVYPADSDFLKRYVDATNRARIVCGGLSYRTDGPTKISPLRYKYGITHEVEMLEQRLKTPYQSFKTSNYFIDKDLLTSIMFDESFIGYGHEDTLFGKRLQQANEQILHIQNPVYHDDNDTAEQFLAKTRKGIDNLLSHSAELEQYSHLLQLYNKIGKLRLVAFIAFLFNRFERRFEQNLLGKNPSMCVFGLYKLGYICQIGKKKRSA